jgi:hypothetical protein
MAEIKNTIFSGHDNYYIYYPQDKTIERVLNKIRTRADAGMIKYNTSMVDNPGDMLYWLNHHQQELLDAAAYVERIIQELERK